MVTVKVAVTVAAIMTWSRLQLRSLSRSRPRSLLLSHSWLRSYPCYRLRPRSRSMLQSDVRSCGSHHGGCYGHRRIHIRINPCYCHNVAVTVKITVVVVVVITAAVTVAVSVAVNAAIVTATVVMTLHMTTIVTATV